MEEHRLQPMGDYDQELFTRLFYQTLPLRKKLARNIDKTRFAVEYEDILSWFDCKFIFVFTKYHKQYDENVLKGHIINALSKYQFRLMKMTYSNKYNQHNFLHVEDISQFEGIIGATKEEDNIYLRAIENFMKSYLSEDAYLILQTELNPPPYILHQISQDPDAKNSFRIKKAQVMDYLGLASESVYRACKREIRAAVKEAQSFFQENPEQVEIYSDLTVFRG